MNTQWILFPFLGGDRIHYLPYCILGRPDRTSNINKWEASSLVMFSTPRLWRCRRSDNLSMQKLETLGLCNLGWEWPLLWSCQYLEAASFLLMNLSICLFWSCFLIRCLIPFIKLISEGWTYELRGMLSPWHSFQEPGRTEKERQTGGLMDTLRGWE